MGLVATLAIACSHFEAVRLVALGTQGNLAMGIVAETTGESGVLALDLLQFNDLWGMTRNALIGEIVGQFDNLRSMRIVVAAQTAGKLVVRFVAVALAAGRDDFLDRRRMACMAILTADLCFVGAAVGSNCSRRCRVTFDTIGIGQHRLRISRSGSQHRHSRQQCR